MHDAWLGQERHVDGAERLIYIYIYLPERRLLVVLSGRTAESSSLSYLQTGL